MEDINANDDLFGTLDNKMDFLSEPTKANSDGVYRINLEKAKDKKRGYRSVIRFLPNLTKEGKVGQSAIEKISHYVDIKNVKELSGFFDSPKNFGEQCALTTLFYQMQNSKNAILMEKSKMLKYSKKYYSYVLILEDEQQPELVGKIMIFQYGKTIKDKIMAEKNGDVSGKSQNVFDLSNGMDFVLLVKEIQTGSETYPDYKASSFKGETSPIQIYDKENHSFRSVPTMMDGNLRKIDPKAQNKVKEFLMDREYDLEAFAPKRLDEAQQAKITDISNYLTGKSSNSFNNKENKPDSGDFDFEEESSEKSTPANDSDDDFFN